MSHPLSSSRPDAGHSPATILLHWLSVLLIVGAVAAVGLRELADDKASRQLLLDIHRQLGLSVLLLLCARVPLHLWQRPAAAAMAWPLRWAAAATHLALYALLLALPLLGWALSDARGQHPLLLGWLHLPTLVATDPDRADLLADAHVACAWALLAAVSLHVAAALWHHWVRRDAVLRAMWPAARRLAPRFPQP